MKTTINFFSALLVALFIGFSAVSCSNDTDPAANVDTDVFFGTFKGSVEYACTNPIKQITETDSEVVMTPTNGTYSFSFDKGIPSITGVGFIRKDENTLVSHNDDGMTDITVTKNSLKIIVVKGGETWRATCTKIR